MGNGAVNRTFSTLFFRPQDNILGQNVESFQFLTDGIQISNLQLRDLHEIFKSVSKGNFATIDSCLEYFDITLTPCSFKIFGHMQCFGHTKLCFLEFMIGIWNFLTIRDEDMKALIFFAFDIDSQLVKDDNSKELRKFIEAIHFCDDDIVERLEIATAFKTVLEKGDKQHIEALIENASVQKQRVLLQSRSSVDTEDPLRLEAMLVTPVLNMQVRLRKFIYGETAWRKFSYKRLALHDFSDISSIDDLKASVRAILVKQMAITAVETHSNRITFPVKPKPQPNTPPAQTGIAKTASSG